MRRYIDYMRTIQDFDNYTPLNEEEGSFDVVRFTIAMRRAVAALEAQDIPKFVSIYNGQIKGVINTSEARKREDLIDSLSAGIDAAKDNLTTEQRREIYIAVMPKLVDQIDKDPELKAAYGI